MTKLQLIEELLDYVINTILENSTDYQNFDVDKFRRTFVDGVLQEGVQLTDIQSLVVYQQDYQSQLAPLNLDLVLNQVADCQWNGTEYEPWGDFNLFVT